MDATEKFQRMRDEANGKMVVGAELEHLSSVALNSLEELRDAIQAANQAGLSLREIAGCTFLSFTTVQRVVNGTHRWNWER